MGSAALAAAVPYPGKVSANDSNIPTQKDEDVTFLTFCPPVTIRNANTLNWAHLFLRNRHLSLHTPAPDSWFLTFRSPPWRFWQTPPPWRRWLSAQPPSLCPPVPSAAASPCAPQSPPGCAGLQQPSSTVLASLHGWKPTCHNVGQIVSLSLQLSFTPSYRQFLDHLPSTMLASSSHSFSNSSLFLVTSSF